MPVVLMAPAFFWVDIYPKNLAVEHVRCVLVTLALTTVCALLAAISPRRPRGRVIASSALQIGQGRGRVFYTSCIGNVSAKVGREKSLLWEVRVLCSRSLYDGVWFVNVPGWASHFLRGKCLISLSGKGGGWTRFFLRFLLVMRMT